MKILVVTQYFWPENFRINDVVLGLKEKGHEVIVFTGKPNYPSGKFYSGYSFWGKSREVWNSITIYRSPLIPRGEGSGVKLILNYLSFAIFSSLKAGFFKEKTVDYIFVYEPSPVTVGIPALILKAKTKAKLLFWVQDLWPQSLEASGGIKNLIILRAADSLTRWIYRHSEKILIQSKAFKSYLKKQKVPNSKIIYYPNSTENYYKPLVKSNRFTDYFTSPYNMVFAGNIGESQSFDTLLKAAQLVKKVNPDIHWIIAGQGRMQSYVFTKVKEYDIEDVFRLIGAFPPEQMADLFSHADALIVSLKKDFIFSLTIPSKVQSYMACAKPIIGSLNGEGKNIIEASNSGLVAESENAEQLAHKVLDFFTLSKDKRNEMGLNSLKYYQNEFERDKLLNRLIEILEST